MNDPFDPENLTPQEILDELVRRSGGKLNKRDFIRVAIYKKLKRDHMDGSTSFIEIQPIDFDSLNSRNERGSGKDLPSA